MQAAYRAAFVAGLRGVKQAAVAALQAALPSGGAHGALGGQQLGKVPPGAGHRQDQHQAVVQKLGQQQWQKQREQQEQ